MKAVGDLENIHPLGLKPAKPEPISPPGMYGWKWIVGSKGLTSGLQIRSNSGVLLESWFGLNILIQSFYKMELFPRNLFSDVMILIHISIILNFILKVYYVGPKSLLFFVGRIRFQFLLTVGSSFLLGRILTRINFTRIRTNFTWVCNPGHHYCC